MRGRTSECAREFLRGHYDLRHLSLGLVLLEYKNIEFVVVFNKWTFLMAFGYVQVDVLVVSFKCNIPQRSICLRTALQASINHAS